MSCASARDTVPEFVLQGERLGCPPPRLALSSRETLRRGLAVALRAKAGDGELT